MHKTRLFLYGLIWGLLLLALSLPSQSAVELSNTGAEYRFGQVKAPPRPLQWKVLNTPHFQIFFYQGLEELAERCRIILEEEAFARVFPDFKDFYTLTPYRKIRVILFASRKEYQNSQASGLSLHDTSEGVAHILVNRLVIIGQPTLRDLRGVLTHEVTHLLTIGPFKDNLLSSLTQGVPGWIAEGIAEYYMPPETRFPRREVALRDVVLRDEVDSLEQISQVRGNLHYAEAWSLVEYLADQYGREKLARMLKAVVQEGYTHRTFTRLYGRDLNEIWKDWREKLDTIYQEGADFPVYSEGSTPILAEYRDQEMVKTTADGRIFFLSNYYGRYYDLCLAEGDKVRPLTDQTVMAFDLSPDGQRLIFLSDQEGERKLYLLSLITGEITPFVTEVKNPIEIAWSPQGDELAVVANEKGDADLYLIGLDGQIRKRIADSLEDETSPAWTPDGRGLVFISPLHGYDQLYLWEGGSVRLLTRQSFHHRKPIWSKEGKLYCLSGDRGYYRPAEVDLTTGWATPIWHFRETVLEVLPQTEDEYLVVLYNKGRTEIYHYTDAPLERRNDDAG
ncbi:MAG: hypothetical protein GX050_10660 [Firmicutes bacterium]|nr:hypothetical protein [Bacillota bacterium]